MIISYIKWRDAVSEEAVSQSAPRAALVELTEVGFLLDENAEAVVIGMEIHNDTEVLPGRWRLHIPVSSIVERRDVEVEKAFVVRKRRK